MIKTPLSKKLLTQKLLPKKLLTLATVLLISLPSYAELTQETIDDLTRNSGIGNLSALSPSEVLRGANPGEAGLQALSKAGVKTVIDLQGGDESTGLIGELIDYWEPGEKPENIAKEKTFAETSGITFVSKPLSSMNTVGEEENKTIREILEIMNDPKMQPVYIHCQFGKDRTGLLAALFRVLHQGWSAEEASKEWAKFGHNGIVDYEITGNLNAYFDKVAPIFQEEWKKAHGTTTANLSP